MAGSYFNRYNWRRFRKRFNDLYLGSHLDYRQYRQLGGREGGVNFTGTYRFTGGMESITDGLTLWVKGYDLTIPVSIEKTKCYLLPKNEGIPEAPEQIRWNHVSTLTEGAKVFIGGQVLMQNNRLQFCSTKENPLMVIFYDCPDADLRRDIISGARTRVEYWNAFTPISIVIGALALIYIAASFLGRPAFHLTVISALVAVFVPILPVFPPGLLFTALHRHLAWHTRKLKANFDLAYFGLLPDSPVKSGGKYAFKAYFLELIAWLVLVLGICINVVFIFLLLIQFEVISF